MLAELCVYVWVTGTFSSVSNSLSSHSRGSRGASITSLLSLLLYLRFWVTIQGAPEA